MFSWSYISVSIKLSCMSQLELQNPNEKYLHDQEIILKRAINLIFECNDNVIIRRLVLIIQKIQNQLPTLYHMPGGTV